MGGEKQKVAKAEEEEEEGKKKDKGGASVPIERRRGDRCGNVKPRHGEWPGRQEELWARGGRDRDREKKQKELRRWGGGG